MIKGLFRTEFQVTVHCCGEVKGSGSYNTCPGKSYQQIRQRGMEEYMYATAQFASPLLYNPGSHTQGIVLWMLEQSSG